MGAGMRIAGVLLAAGSSSRMGGPNKLFLEIDGESLLRRSAMRAVDAGLDTVIVVLGHDVQRARRELAGIPAGTVWNRDHALGVNGSLRAGIAAAAPRSDAAIVLLADMPLVTAEMIAAVAEKFRESAAPLVISDYGGVQAPPTLYARALFPELLAAGDGEGAGKAVVARNLERAAVLTWPRERLHDLDVPEDWERLRR
jgi:molybdenum cofactor cytidylyltransferase